jgi:hypothetical protein
MPIGIAKKETVTISSSYDDSYEASFYACELQSYDVYVFYRKA